MFGHVPLLAAGFAGDCLSPDLTVLQQVEQSPRAEQAEEKGGTTKKHKGHKGRLGSPELADFVAKVGFVGLFEDRRFAVRCRRVAATR
jgi:hypothetical protein